MTATLDNRSSRELLMRKMLSRIPGYLPGWKPLPGEPAQALLHTSTRMLERLELEKQTALKYGQMAFLDTLNERRLPAQAAEVPVVFTLAENAASDVPVPTGTVIQAEPAQGQNDPPLFATTEAVTIARAKMVKVYSVLSDRDMYTDHTSDLASGFYAFKELNPVEHALYLGDELFNLPPGGCGSRNPDDATEPQTLLRIKFDFRKLVDFEYEGKLVQEIAPTSVEVQWEFYSGDGWFPLEEISGGKNRPLGGLFGEELVVLRKPFGPGSEKSERFGHETYWIRMRLTQPLPEQGIDGRGSLPMIDRIFATSESSSSALMLDEAIGVNHALNLREPFYPFGKIPRMHDLFYFACREAFQRSYAQIQLAIKYAEGSLKHGNAKLVWEYFNGKGWAKLHVKPDFRIVSYEWDFGEDTDSYGGNPDLLKKNKAVGISPAHSYSKAGNYTVKLTVTDSNGESNTEVSTVNVTEPPAAGAPKAIPKLVEDGLYMANKTITFDGSDSYASNGPISTYEWDFGDGGTASGVTPTHSYAKPGIYTITLEVKDGQDQTNAATTIVSITDSLGGPYRIKIGGSINFDYSGAYNSSNVTNITYDWDFGDGFRSSEGKQEHTYSAAGSYIVRLTVTESNGDVSSATTTVEVPNHTPVANPGGPYMAEVGEVISFNGSDSFDPAGSNYRFTRPTDWEELEVNGSKNYWVRIRIESGNYGELPRHEWNNDVNPPRLERIGELHVPVISQMFLSFTHASPTLAVRAGTTSNDFIETDISSALAIPGRTFRPFQRVNLSDTAFYLAFDRPLPGALVSLYVHSLEDSELRLRPSRFLWEYWSRDGWRDLSIRDNTRSFTQSGTVQFVGPWDAVPSPGLGGSLYRIRARLKEGEAADPVELGGLWFNAIMANHERRYPRIPIGESNGNPHQLFRVGSNQLPVLAGQQLEIREWAKDMGGAPPFLEDLPEDTRVINDPATQRPAEIWVRWQERDGLFDSKPDDRHYTIDRATGTIRFGDGVYGRIPPPASRLQITHRTGGGLEGNVAAHTVLQPRAVIAGLQATDNPRPALGGAPTESLDDTLRRGPQRLRHGDRAITESDYEWLAQEASRAVARARCLPLTGQAGGGQRGWVSIIIIPHSTATQPQPDAELCREVRDALRASVPAPIARRIRVVPPSYAEISVAAVILPSTNADLTSLSQRLRTALDNYLHPLSGGASGQGWQMGARIYLSQVAQIIEAMQGVDKALELRVRIDGNVQGQVAQLDEYLLPAAGAHELSFRFEEGS